MELKFYKQAATPNRVDKSGYLTEIGILGDVTLKADTNLMRPTFILKTSPLVYNSNYLYNSFTKRYYYIKQITALSGGRIAIDCEIDVLYTYKTEILQSSGWVVRSDSTSSTADDYDMLHNDLPYRQDFDTLGLNFAGGDGPFSSVSDRNICFIIK